MPHRTNIRKYREKSPEFASRYAQARIDQQDSYCDEIIRLARTANETNWQAIQVQIRTLQWVMARVSRKVYGDDVSLLGASGPVEIVVRRVGMDDPVALPEPHSEALDGFELLRNGTQRCVREVDRERLLGDGDDSKEVTGTWSNHAEAKNGKVSSNPGLEPSEVIPLGNSAIPASGGS